MERLRQDPQKRAEEQARDTNRRSLARHQPASVSAADAMEVVGQHSQPEPMDVDVGIDGQDTPGPAGDVVLSPADLLRFKRREHFLSLNSNNFDTDLFTDNPLLEAGKEFHRELEKTSWSTCSHCTEKYICMAVRPRSGKCERCTRNPQLFAEENDLTPSVAPPCLSDLTPIEKLCISLICPVIGIYKKGHSAASRGHTISVIQDVNVLASTLPRLPANLPFIVIKGPNERIVDQNFRVRRQALIDALLYLKDHNEDYRSVTRAIFNQI
jgi:hypothetical protein